MKKLATLMAVAALAAFGWASGAKADPLAGEVTSCVVEDHGAGLAVDHIHVEWLRLDDPPDVDAYGVSAWCMDPETGRAKHTKVEVDNSLEDFGVVGAPCDLLALPRCTTTILLTDFNGFNSMRDGDLCMVTVKALHFPGPNKEHDVAMLACAGALDEFP